MADGSIADALHAALVARREVADRPDRCRAVLGDVLGSDVANHRREVALLIAAVEEHVPEALRGATTPGDLASIAARFQIDRALEPTAARWAVDIWSDALRSVGVTSIPATETSGGASVFNGAGDENGLLETRTGGLARTLADVDIATERSRPALPEPV
nr:hypothetical protein [Actinomycetota bacterium]